MNIIIIRQGDVLLRQVKKPEGEWVKKADYTVALGEQTGHHHTIYSPPQKYIEVLEEAGHRFINVDAGFWLKHQEHDHIEIPAGTYEIIMEREFDYIENQRKQVVD